LYTDMYRANMVRYEAVIPCKHQNCQ